MWLVNFWLFSQIFMMHIKQPNSDDLCFSPTYSLLCSVAIPVEQLWVKTSCRNQTGKSLFLHTTRVVMKQSAATCKTQQRPAAPAVLSGCSHTQALWPPLSSLSAPQSPSNTTLCIVVLLSKVLMEPFLFLLLTALYYYCITCVGHTAHLLYAYTLKEPGSTCQHLIVKKIQIMLVLVSKRLQCLGQFVGYLMVSALQSWFCLCIKIIKMRYRNKPSASSHFINP